LLSIVSMFGSEQESDQVRANGQFGGKSLIG